MSKNTTFYSPSIYELLHQKAGNTAYTGLFLPDTVLFQHSEPCAWYFSSR